jgi:hypothetical protein
MKKLLALVSLVAVLAIASLATGQIQDQSTSHHWIGNHSLQMVPHVRPTAPIYEGQIYQDSSDHKLYVYNGSTWLPLGIDLSFPSVSTPLATPGAATPTPGAGGALNNGTYGFRIVAVDPNGGLSLPGVEATCTTVAGAASGSCALAWSAVAGAASYRVYGQAVGAEDHYVAVRALTYTWTDPALALALALPTTNTATAYQFDASSAWFNRLLVASSGNAITLGAAGQTISVAANTAVSVRPVTVSAAGVALGITSSAVEVTTDGTAAENKGSLANGTTVGQTIHVYVKVAGNAGDSFTITPATMLGGTNISFGASPLGKGATFVWTSAGWVCIGNNGGTIS